MNKKLLWTLLALCVNSLFAQSRWNNYETADYSIQYPSDWELMTDGDFLCRIPEFTILGPDNHPFMMVQLFYYERDVEVESWDDIDLSIFCRNYEAKMKSCLRKFSVVEYALRRSAAGTYIRLTYSYEQIEKMKAVNLFFLENDNCGYYSLQFTTRQKDFEKCKKIGEEILHTFYIEK